MGIISIIVPCFNQAHYLSETLQSVLDQTYNKWECLIIDDGSKDETAIVAKLWVDQDVRFKYYYKENGGLSSARNTGLDKAIGDYIQFLDSDDTINSNKFQFQLLDLEHCEISICDYFPSDDKTELRIDWRYLNPFLEEENYKRDLILDWENKISIPCHSVLFKKEILNSHSIRFEEHLPNHEDWVFWSKVFYHSKGIKNNPEILATYRIRDISMSADYKLMRKGFVLAAENLLDYFTNIDDREFIGYSKLKLAHILKRNKQIESKKHFVLNLIKRFARKINKIIPKL